MESRFRESVIRKIQENIHLLSDEELKEIAARLDQMHSKIEYVKEYIKTGMMVGE